MFSNVWSENTALFERLMEIRSNSPKLYYGFNGETIIWKGGFIKLKWSVHISFVIISEGAISANIQSTRYCGVKNLLGQILR